MNRDVVSVEVLRRLGEEVWNRLLLELLWERELSQTLGQFCWHAKLFGL